MMSAVMQWAGKNTPIPSIHMMIKGQSGRRPVFEAQKRSALRFVAARLPQRHYRIETHCDTTHVSGV